MNDITLIMEYLDSNDYSKYETPELITLCFHHNRYEFFITSYCSDIYNEKEDFLGLEVLIDNYTIANYGIYASEDEKTYIYKEKIVVSPKYKRTILNFYNRIKKTLRYLTYTYKEYIDENGEYIELNGYELTGNDKEEILDIWQLIIKEIFKKEKGENK